MQMENDFEEPSDCDYAMMHLLHTPSKPIPGPSLAPAVKEESVEQPNTSLSMVNDFLNSLKENPVLTKKSLEEHCDRVRGNLDSLRNRKERTWNIIKAKVVGHFHKTYNLKETHFTEKLKREVTAILIKVSKNIKSQG